MASLERPCFLWARGWLHICYPPVWCVPGDLNYWSCSIPQIMTTLNTGSRPHRPINTGTVWSRGRKLETVTFQMDTYLYEAFVWWGKRTWSAISQVCEDCVFFEAAAQSVRPNGQSQWTPENCSRGSERVTAALKQMMSNCAVRVRTQMLYFFLESWWELGYICTKCCNLRFQKMCWTKSRCELDRLIYTDNSSLNWTISLAARLM